MKYPFVLIDWCRLACCLLLILWMPARATAQETQRRMMAHGGIERSYELRLPPGESRSPRPLVLSLHGLSRSPDPLIGHRAWLPMDSIADREGFVIAYPVAVEGRWSFWPGTGVVQPDGTEVDDVGFVLALLDTLVADGTADPRRLYAVGISRGAMLSWVLGCRLSDRLAAIAPLSSPAREALLAGCAPKMPPAVMAIAGVADPVQLYDGWLDPPPLGRLLSMPETMELWRRLHGCTGQSFEALPHRDRADPTRIGRITWTGCASGLPVLLYRVIGGGHQPPSFTPNSDAERARFGRRANDMETGEEVWRFFQPIVSPGP